MLRIALAETGTVAREPVDLSELVASMVELYAPVSEERGITLESAVAPGAQVQGSRQLLAQALANLLDNAIKFTPDGGHIRVLLQRLRAGNPKSSSRTTGREFRPTSARSSSADAYVSMKRANFQGRALGLSLVAAVTKLHGARLILDDAKAGLEGFPQVLKRQFIGG